jgi:hypothetical protein
MPRWPIVAGIDDRRRLVAVVWADARERRAIDDQRRDPPTSADARFALANEAIVDVGAHHQ